METICTFASTGLGGTFAALSAAAALSTVMLITISYMVGSVLSNPKIHLWAKTELVQLFVSIASVGMIFLVIQSFCSIDFGALYGLTEESAAVAMPNVNVFGAAEAYLIDAGIYTHRILEIERYHLMSYNMLMLRGRYDCVFGPLLCLFGNAGTSISPYPWSSASLAAMTVSFNATFLSYVTILTSLFILFYASSGFALFLLPLGILFRSLPYLRSLGSLLITVVFAFVIVYPTMLALFYLVENSSADPVLFSFIDDSILDYEDPSDVVDVGVSVWDWPGDDDDKYWGDDYIDEFFPSGHKESIVYQLAGRAFIVGAFIPLLAVLGTVASVNHVARILGEEIDLSKIVRMV